MRLITRLIFVAVLVLVFLPHSARAATLRLSPETGIYTAGNTFTVTVSMNTQGKPVNAADAQLTFNPNELSVVSASRSSSIFNLWTLEPTFSNSGGTVSFGGGSPSGYTGANGTIASITFRALGAGTPKVNFKTGSILAADGLGTNILTAMTGGTYTIGAKTDTPAPEYIPPASTPSAPKVTSTTHPNESSWYRMRDVELAWTLPSGVTAVRTLLDTAPSTIPTIVYEEPITSRTVNDLDDGTAYFHIQFKNADGWGRVTHFKINVDNEAPKDFTIREDSEDATNPRRTLIFESNDISPVTKYEIQVDGGAFTEFLDREGKKHYVLDMLPPGRHTVVGEAFDSAGNSSVSSYSFEISSFEAPIFTEAPERVNSGVIPAIRGVTRSRVHVDVTVRESDREYGVFRTESNDDGVFTFIPDKAFPQGVYEITAIATDDNGARSEPSQVLRIIVEEPGYVTIGTIAVRALSIIVPLVALVLLLVFGSWYLLHTIRRWKRKIMKETLEVEDKLRIEFNAIISHLHANVSALKESRKGKLTQAESVLISEIEQDLTNAQTRIQKEIKDIEDVVE